MLYIFFSDLIFYLIMNKCIIFPKQHKWSKMYLLFFFFIKAMDASIFFLYFLLKTCFILAFMLKKKVKNQKMCDSDRHLCVFGFSSSRGPEVWICPQLVTLLGVRVGSAWLFIISAASWLQTQFKQLCHRFQDKRIRRWIFMGKSGVPASIITANRCMWD